MNANQNPKLLVLKFIKIWWPESTNRTWMTISKVIKPNTMYCKIYPASWKTIQLNQYAFLKKIWRTYSHNKNSHFAIKSLKWKSWESISLYICIGFRKKGFKGIIIIHPWVFSISVLCVFMCHMYVIYALQILNEWSNVKYIPKNSNYVSI